ncbi:uncharacterized protein V2V93DRAFT_367046 [Kockiozyma suomiensis]|uniref:uncharacterized protein n=1 Tax=Kockiozyma suomiensis TaxID=1337062 RepID=UPI003343C64D
MRAVLSSTSRYYLHFKVSLIFSVKKINLIRTVRTSVIQLSTPAHDLYLSSALIVSPVGVNIGICAPVSMGQRTVIYYAVLDGMYFPVISYSLLS